MRGPYQDSFIASREQIGGIPGEGQASDWSRVPVNCGAADAAVIRTSLYLSQRSLKAVPDQDPASTVPCRHLSTLCTNRQTLQSTVEITTWHPHHKRTSLKGAQLDFQIMSFRTVHNNFLMSFLSPPKTRDPMC